ncbi:recombinase family protein [Variovorax sp. YR566]|uniref:recombinase family protein n=1 Tax=Variovorax sp. YR566 TaxID=3450237 RepID=UPI003F7DB53D
MNNLGTENREVETDATATKLDRLGRNAMDVRSTVETLAAAGIRVHCLALGGVDLTSPAGRMTMGVIAAVAEFERDLILERTQAGLERAKVAGVSLGRPTTFADAQAERIRARSAAASRATPHRPRPDATHPRHREREEEQKQKTRRKRGTKRDRATWSAP